jgi:hypothetical protein
LTEPLRSEPRTICTGDTLSWAVAAYAGSFPASQGWALTYYFALAAETPEAVPATPDGDGFAVTWSCALVPGRYRWFAQVVKGEVKRVLREGVLQVRPDPSAAFDRRTQAEINLEAVNAALAGRVGDPLLKYKIDGIEAEKIAPRELLALRDRFTTEVRIQRGGSLVRNLPVGGRW